MAQINSYPDATETTGAKMIGHQGGTTKEIPAALFADDDHDHAIADVTGLQVALDGKADGAATTAALAGKAAASHTHAISDVTNLQTVLDGKAAAAAAVPAGGSTGQVLKKNSGTDYDASWATDNTGEGGGSVDSVNGATGVVVLDLTDLGASTFGAELAEVADAAAARTKVGVGTIATQAANSVAITGGSVTGITDLAVADGGTGASDASGARTNLGLGTIATQAANSVSITGGSVTGITDLAVADGGTGASDAATARTNLGVASASHNHAAADITSGTVATARLGSGTANSSSFLRGDQTWAAVSVGDDYDIVTASNPGSPYTASGLTGHAIISITGITGAKTINKPTGTWTSGKRYWVALEITATGGPFAITLGSGISHSGLGVAPSLSVPANGIFWLPMYTDDGGTTFKYNGDAAGASDTVAGPVELATASETNTGTDATRAVTPDALAASYAGTVRVRLIPKAAIGEDIETGDGQDYFDVSASMNGMNLVSGLGGVGTAGSGGTTDFQVRRVRSGTPADMFSTKITIDSGEVNSTTAAAAPVINSSNDDVQTGDRIYLDVDAVPGTAPKDGGVVLEFRLP